MARVIRGLVFLMAFLLASLPSLADSGFSASAVPDESFTRFFDRCGPGITGGDSTYSTPVNGQQILWLFSDFFVGRVAAEGKRSNASSTFVQGNTIALQNLETGSLTSYLGLDMHEKLETQVLPDFSASPYDLGNCPVESYQVPAVSRAMFTPPVCPTEKHCYFWANAPLVQKGRLYAFLQLMQQTGSNAFDFARHNTVLAMVPMDELADGKVEYIDVPDNGVSYGGAVLDDNKKWGSHFIYIYGMRVEPEGSPLCSGHCLHVARVPSGKLMDFSTWRYWGKGSQKISGWVKQAKDSVPMVGATGLESAPMTQDQLGIIHIDDCRPAMKTCYVIIAHRYTGGFTTEILAWYSANPQGPWYGPTHVYTTPESSQPGQLFTYNAKVHPEFTDNNGLLVSYDVNGLAPFTDPLTPFITAASYRPRFIRVKLYWGQSSQ